MDHPVSDPNCRCYFQPATTPAPFSLSAPCRPASSYAGSIVIAAPTPPPLPSSSNCRCCYQPQLRQRPSPFQRPPSPLPSHIGSAFIARCLLSLPIVAAPLLPSPYSVPCHPLCNLQWCHSPWHSLNPSSLPTTCRRCHPPIISLPALLLNSYCNPQTVESNFLLSHCFLLPFPSSVHRSLSLLFITRCSSITAHTMLSASPSDTLVVVVFSLLPRSLLMTLLILCRQCLFYASPTLYGNLPTAPIVSHTCHSSPPPQATSPLSPMLCLSFSYFCLA
ncbi:hypothetical protein BHE74_00034075 [Ensete ventricosum]|nr:hypothetical protein BHE74_00034075 [Ensete ventricosum]RZS29213.1 hypothetical protein BHM03_00062919 [Ensete ventricosum]